jgi:rhomboid family GlyGly-CTERM serine protease
LLLGSVPALQPYLILEDASVFKGQIWRLFTGHFVHLGKSHLVMNLVACLAIFVWAWRIDRVKTTSIFVLICCPVLGAILIAGGTTWYAGLSGILHGALVLLIMQMPVRILVLGMAIVFTKLAWQYFMNGQQLVLEPSTPVSQASHWLGVLLGLIFHFIYVRFTRKKHLKNSTFAD